MQRQLQSEGPVAAPSDAVREILKFDPSGALASRPAAVGTRKFPMEVRVETDGGVAAGLEVMVELGDADETAPDEFPLSWVPIGHTKLLPGFQGTIAVLADGASTRVRVAGSYRPPLGWAGRFGDGLVGHRVARRSLDALVAVIAARLGNEVRRRSEFVAPRPEAEPDLAGDRQPAENWLG